uniref:7TM_GPCR_Srx domain-containing protein n=1 Tax=Heligmosomoides polygyrus TaxID=6339 RepID=A0A183GWQ6_HELPZ
LQTFHRQVVECQKREGFFEDNGMIEKKVVWFHVIIFLEVFILTLYNISYYMGTEQTEFVIQLSKVIFV